MKTTIQFSFLFVILSMALACGPQAEENANEQQSEVTEESHSESAGETDEVQLNNGEPWDANPETTTGIRNMQELMNKYAQVDQVDECQELKDSLNAEFGMIIQKCTMKGEAHNQLHNYLIPLKGQIKELAAGDMEDCQTAIVRINAHLDSYSQYFK